MSEQQAFWAGPAGDAYTDRCPGDVPNALAFFAKALSRAQPVHRIVELGAGSGTNLAALQLLYPQSYTLGVDVNAKAVENMERRGIEALCAPITEVTAQHVIGTYDLVLTKGLLIHLDEEALYQAFSTIMRLADRYVLLCEYYRPARQPIHYQGRNDLLWGDDFATRFLHVAGDLFSVIDYGFTWRYDNWPQDDVTWFLIERR